LFYFFVALALCQAGFIVVYTAFLPGVYQRDADEGCDLGKSLRTVPPRVRINALGLIEFLTGSPEWLKGFDTEGGEPILGEFETDSSILDSYDLTPEEQALFAHVGAGASKEEHHEHANHEEKDKPGQGGAEEKDSGVAHVVADTGWSTLSDVQAGQHRLAVIVPFRDSASKTSQGGNRTAQLRHFVPYMSDWLTRVGNLAPDDFILVVVEQTEGVIFNKGALFNAAFTEIKDKVDYVVFHDIDQLPIDETNTYAYSRNPRHLCTASSQFDFKMAYNDMVGGALMITSEHVTMMNGYSNMYWGWGREDDDLYFRLVAFPNHNHVPAAEAKLTRNTRNQGRYQAQDHDRVMDLDATKMFDNNNELLKSKGSYRSKDVLMADGLNTVKYILRSQQLLDGTDGSCCKQYPTQLPSILYAHLLVELDFEWMPTGLHEARPKDYLS
jgi:hypothetical protein